RTSEGRQKPCCPRRAPTLRANPPDTSQPDTDPDASSRAGPAFDECGSVLRRSAGDRASRPHEPDQVDDVPGPGGKRRRACVASPPTEGSDAPSRRVREEGWNDMDKPPLLQRALVEVLGTFGFFFLGFMGVAAATSISGSIGSGGIAA